MNFKSISSLVVILILIGGVTAIAKDEHTGTIVGRVLDNNSRHPIVGVKVSVVGKKLGVHTDIGGNFKIANIEPGEYMIKFSRLDYVTAEVEQVQVIADLSSVLDQPLKENCFELNWLTLFLLSSYYDEKYNVPVVSIIEQLTGDDFDEQVSNIQSDTDKLVIYDRGGECSVSLLIENIDFDRCTPDNEYKMMCCSERTGNIDNDIDDVVDIDDLTYLVDYLFGTMRPPECLKSGNVDGDPNGVVNIEDLCLLVDHLFINFTPIAACQ